MSFSRSNENTRSLEHSESPVDVFQVINVAIVLILRPVSEKRDTHVLNAFLAVGFPTLELLKNSFLLLGCYQSRARWSLVHLDFKEGALAFLFLLLAEALEVLGHLRYILRLEVLPFDYCGLASHLMHLVFHLVLADSPHVFLDEVLLILGPLPMILDHITAFDIDRLGLKRDSRDLGRNLCKLLHLKGQIVLYIQQTFTTH